MNVDILRVIQIGITFSDEDGNFPSDSPSTWQFHFAFSLQSDTYAEDSIQLLRTAGIDFARHRSVFTATAVACFLVFTSTTRPLHTHSPLVPQPRRHPRSRLRRAADEQVTIAEVFDTQNQ